MSDHAARVRSHAGVARPPNSGGCGVVSTLGSILLYPIWRAIVCLSVFCTACLSAILRLPLMTVRFALYTVIYSLYTVNVIVWRARQACAIASWAIAFARSITCVWLPHVLHVFAHNRYVDIYLSIGTCYEYLVMVLCLLIWSTEPSTRPPPYTHCTMPGSPRGRWLQR